MLAGWVSREAALEEITDVLLMTDSDYFNALAAVELHQELGRDHVYRLPSREELRDLLTEHTQGASCSAQGSLTPPSVWAPFTQTRRGAVSLAALSSGQ